MDVLISTLYKGTASIQSIKLFSPDMVYFVVDKPIDDVRKHSLEMIRFLFQNLKIRQIPVKTYDIVDIAESIIKIIQKEEKNNINIHISEGRKTMCLGVLFGSYVMKDYIDSAYYIIEETNQPLKIPLVELKISKKKKEVLRLIADGYDTVDKLVKKMDINRSTLYVHFKELRDDGFLDEDNTRTPMGKIVLIH